MQPQEEEEDGDEETYDKISESARETSGVLPPHVLLAFQTIRRVKSDEVSDITRQLQRVDHLIIAPEE